MNLHTSQRRFMISNPREGVTNARTLTVTVKRERNASTYTHPAPYRGRVSKLRLVLSEGKAEADRPHGHAGRPQPYLQHGEQQEAPNNLAAGAHPSSVIVPSRDALSTRTGFPGPETLFPDRVRSRAAPPPARSDRGHRRIFPVGGRSPGESSLVEGAFKKGPEARGSQGARSPAPESGAVQSSAASQVSAGKSRSLCFRDPFRLSFLSPPSRRASLPQILRGTAQSISRPLAWSPFLCFRGNTKCFCESLGPQAERADDIQHHASHSCCVARKSDLV